MSDTELALLIDRFMRRIHGALQTKSSGFDRNNIGPGGGIILLTLSDMGCTGLSELTSRVARDKSQMTRSIRSLEAKGLLGEGCRALGSQQMCGRPPRGDRSALTRGAYAPASTRSDPRASTLKTKHTRRYVPCSTWSNGEDTYLSNTLWLHRMSVPCPPAPHSLGR